MSVALTRALPQSQVDLESPAAVTVAASDPETDIYNIKQVFQMSKPAWRSYNPVSHDMHCRTDRACHWCVRRGVNGEDNSRGYEAMLSWVHMRLKPLQTLWMQPL